MKNKELDSLIERMKSKEEGTFEELYTKSWKIIYYIAYRYLNNVEAAKDVTQEAFITIYRKIDSLNDGAAFNAWINRIVLNICYKHKSYITKRNYIDIETMNEELIEDNIEFLPAQLLEDKNMKTEVIEEISKLPDELKIVILLYYFEEMPIAEIAETLKIVDSAVYKRLMKARHVLKENFEKKYMTVEASSSLAGVAIITLILQQNSKIICTDNIGKTIYKNVNKEINLLNSNLGASLNSIIKIIVSISLVSIISFGGYMFLSNQNKGTHTQKQSQENVIEQITLATFIGESNAKLVEGWKEISERTNNTTFVDILNKNQVVTEYFYIEPGTRVMYVLYKKIISDKMLLIIERFDSSNRDWQVTYDIVDSSTKIINEENINQWFEQFKQKEK